LYILAEEEFITTGRIACRREGVFFPIENALSARKGGWKCTAQSMPSTIALFHFGVGATLFDFVIIYMWAVDCTMVESLLSTIVLFHFGVTSAQCHS